MTRPFSDILRLGSRLTTGFFLGVAFLSMSTVALAAKPLRMEELKVEGQAQKPQVSFILQRNSKINLDVEIQRFRPKFSGRNFEIFKEKKQLFEQR